jgi:DNA-binding phage protein
MTLKEIIKKSGMTKEFIHREAEVSRTRLYLAISGDYTLNNDEVKRLSKVLRVSQVQLKEAQQ